jgi:riboflavin kinase/FMN adenylyltransferase
LLHKALNIYPNFIPSTEFFLLVGRLRFHLGVDNSGDIDTLTALSRKLGYQVHAIQPFQSSSAIISSSLIRDFIKNGDIEQANDLLGRPYTVEGRIVHGDARGRQIGMRTANLDIWEERLLPAGGVYAVMAESGGRKWKSVVNIGNRPTFYEKPVLQTVEAHLLDFDQDIYGKDMQLKFYRSIRAEKKFDNADQLMLQINQDIQFAREVLDHEPKQTNLSA